MNITKLSLTVAAGLLASAAFSSSTLFADYYAMSNNPGHGIEKVPDAGNGIDGHIVTGLVEDHLDANGLPIVTSKGMTYSGASGPIHDYNHNMSSTSYGELQWWTVHNPTANSEVVFDSSANVTAPIDSSEFAFGATNNKKWFRTAHLSGDFTTPAGGSVTFTVGSDDDCWVFLNGKLVVDDGGVHAYLPAPITVAGLNPGVNDLEIFFADRHTTEAHLYFASDVHLNPVPEPASMTALGLGLVGMIARRRKS